MLAALRLDAFFDKFEGLLKSLDQNYEAYI